MSSNDRGHETNGASNGPYVLREILRSVPLTDGGDHDGGRVYITCVENWNGNLYIGTSAGDLLHYLSLPSDDGDSASPTWIQCSRTSLGAEEHYPSPNVDLSVKQILLLPAANKACILCQGSITFYTLPELSPAFTNTKLTNCTWIGGVDQNMDASHDDSNNSGTVMMICQKSRIRLVKVGERISKVRDIGFGNCLAAIRRGNIACVADKDEYSLLDVVDQQRIPLFSISSSSTSDLEHDVTAVRVQSGANSNAERPHPVNQDPKDPSERQPLESTAEEPITAQPEQPAVGDETRLPAGLSEPSIAPFPPRQSSLAQSEVPLAPSPAEAPMTSQPSSQSQIQPGPIALTILSPVLASPNPDEFLLATGTSLANPGVGIFINADGEPTPRGTMEFSSFPTSLCVDGTGMDMSANLDPGMEVSEGYVLAVVSRGKDDESRRSVQIRRWDLDPTEPENIIHWLDLDSSSGRPDQAKDANPPAKPGVCTTTGSISSSVDEVASILGPSRLNLETSLDASTVSDEDRQRERVESQLFKNLARFESNMVGWADDCIWSIARNPLILRMEARMTMSVQFADAAPLVDRGRVEAVLNDVRDVEPRTELEFYSLNYIRQKASILLFVNLLSRAHQNHVIHERDRLFTARALSEGDVDPRVLLTLFSDLKEEVLEGSDGVWTQRGVKDIIGKCMNSTSDIKRLKSLGPSGLQILHIVKEYMLVWRKKKGLASITNEVEVFASVDAALVRLLLILDSESPPGIAKKGTVRHELNGVIDGDVDCFDRAIVLLEEYKRLYVLSRLYQSRRQSGQVLAIWKRIVEGEEDAGGEMGDGEERVRKYLRGIEDPALVEEYGAWLAHRNPRLGVRVFADGGSKVHFTPEQAVVILKEHAPGAVKIFLEYLVFENNLAAYANDLINYYLDSVLTELESSESSRSTLLSSYRLYRALKTPKPSYSHFADDQHIDTEWWLNRLRLLQLLGGSHGAASQYDVPGMLSRIRPFEQELIPEMIVLVGKQGQHQEAIRLLVNGLGDFDTAVNYCLRGGSSTYSPLAGSLPQAAAPSREQQASLFRHLLAELLALEDPNDQMTQTSELLERFAGWFDPIHVISEIPESWSVEMVSGFLETSMRQLVTERNEAAITRALLNADNLTANVSLIEKLESLLPRLEQLGDAVV